MEAQVDVVDSVYSTSDLLVLIEDVKQCNHTRPAAHLIHRIVQRAHEAGFNQAVADLDAERAPQDPEAVEETYPEVDLEE